MIDRVTFVPWAMAICWYGVYAVVDSVSGMTVRLFVLEFGACAHC